jgi:hypothetical protein
MGVMSNFNDVYPNKYQVSDYGLMLRAFNALSVLDNEFDGIDPNLL